MNESRRIITSDQSACPQCGHDTAVVRVRGNGFAATCVACRYSEIAPMLTGAELDAVAPDREPVPVVSIMRARHERAVGRASRAELPERELLVSRTVFDDSPDFTEHIDRALDRAVSVKLRLPTS